MISYVASDGSGKSCSGSVSVCVPRNGRHPTCVDDGQRFNSLGPCPKDCGRGDDDDDGGHSGDDAAANVTLTSVEAAGGSALLEYSLPIASNVSIALFDIAGRRVATLQNGPQNAGMHQVSWDTSSLESGMYFYRLQAGRVVLSRSVLILKQ